MRPWPAASMAPEDPEHTRLAPHADQRPTLASLKMLERIQLGFNRPDENSDVDRSPENSNHDEFERKKPVDRIHIGGWVSIHQIYEQERNRYLMRIAVGFSVIFSLLYTNENFWPVAAVFALANFFKAVVCFFELMQTDSKNTRKKVEIGLDLNISVCYFVLAFGFLLLFNEVITCRYFIYFSVPYLLVAFALLFWQSEESANFNLKKFQIFEAVQLFLIAAKFTPLEYFTWSVTLIYFKICSIYLIGFGFVLLLIFTVSFFSNENTSDQFWKVKGMLILIKNYLTNGFVYFYLIRGMVQFFGEEITEVPGLQRDFIAYKSGSSDTLLLASIFLIFTSLINLIVYVISKKSVKMFLSKVIYKHETQRIVSLRFLDKSFEFKLVRISASYFSRNSAAPASQTSEFDQEDQCVLCFDKTFDVYFDPCGHSGICRECLYKFLEQKGKRCPFCKEKIEKMFIISQMENEKHYKAQGEIQVHC